MGGARTGTVGQAARHRENDLHVIRQAELPTNGALKLSHAVNARPRCYDVSSAVDLDGHWDAVHELVVVLCKLAR